MTTLASILNILAQTAPTDAWWGLVLGPFGALALSLYVNWLLWQQVKTERETSREDIVKLTTALETNTGALKEARDVQERVEKRLAALENE